MVRIMTLAAVLERMGSNLSSRRWSRGWSVLLVGGSERVWISLEANKTGVVPKKSFGFQVGYLFERVPSGSMINVRYYKH